MAYTKLLTYGGKKIYQMKELTDAVVSEKRLSCEKLITQELEELLEVMKREDLYRIGRIENDPYFEYRLEEMWNPGKYDELDETNMLDIFRIPEGYQTRFGREQDLEDDLMMAQRLTKQPQDMEFLKDLPEMQAKLVTLYGKNATVIFRQVKESGLETAYQYWVYMLLTAIYNRLKLEAEDFPVRREEIKGLKDLNDNSHQGRLSRILTRLKEEGGEAESSIPLLPSEEPYEFPLYTDAGLPEGMRIKTWKLYHASDYSQYKVVIKRAGKERGQDIVLKPTEFIYLTAVDGKVVRFLPDCADNGEFRVKRDEEDKELLTVWQNRTRLMEKPDVQIPMTAQQCKGITSFAPTDGGGFLAVRNGQVCTEFAEQDWKQVIERELESQMRSGIRFIEVGVRRGFYYFLDENGNVYTNDRQEKQKSCRISLKMENR